MKLSLHATFIEPMLAMAVKELPSGPEWSYELKLDGYRALGLKNDGAPRLYSRNGKDFSGRFPSVTRALETLPDETLIDGEVVAVDVAGRHVRQIELSERHREIAVARVAAALNST